MIDVVIDTSIYRADPKREKAAFRILTKLATNGFVRVHIPHVVEREFSTQQLTSLESTLAEARKFISSARKRVSEPLIQEVNGIEKLIEAFRANAEAEVASSLSKWAKDINAEIHATQPHHGELVLNAYFSGDAPFSQPKERKDFPDAFIYESIQDLAKLKGSVHVVSADENLRNACSKIKGVTAYDALEEFLKSEPCIDAAHHLEHLEKLNQFRVNIGSYASAFLKHVNQLLLDYLPYKQFEDPHFKSDDNSGAVEMMNESEDIELDESKIEILGVDTLLVPFSCRLGALVYYSIFAADYWAMADNESLGISVHYNENSSDHYLEANEDVTLEINGVFSVSFEFDVGEAINDPETDFASYLEDADVTLEDVKSIQVVEE
ncbi:MAG: PIN domain-containing protein [Sulfuricella sp.]|jgi:hypothetical protein